MNTAIKDRRLKKPVNKYVDETQHILDAINSDGFENEPYFNPCNTEQEKALFLRARFMSEYRWNVERIGEFKALTEWLQGLALNIAFTNYDILVLYKKWNGIEIMTEKQEEKILDNYWRFMAMRIISLWKKHKVA